MSWLTHLTVALIAFISTGVAAQHMTSVPHHSANAAVYSAIPAGASHSNDSALIHNRLVGLPTSTPDPTPSEPSLVASAQPQPQPVASTPVVVPPAPADPPAIIPSASAPAPAPPVYHPAPPPPAAPPVAPRPPALVIGSTQQALINQDRAAAGLPPLTWNGCLASIAIQNAQRMARQGYISHAGGASADLTCGLGNQAGENVGYWSGGITDTQLNTMFMNSPEHRSNIMGPYRYVGTAWAVGADGKAYIAVEFS